MQITKKERSITKVITVIKHAESVFEYELSYSKTDSACFITAITLVIDLSSIHIIYLEVQIRIDIF